MLKVIAKKILKREIEEKNKELDELRDEKSKMLTDYCSLFEDFKKTRICLEQSLEDEKNKTKQLEYQNAVLRQYYHFDEEPSEEIKDKLRIDIKCHEMELEITRLMAIVNRSPEVVRCIVSMPPYSMFNYPRLY